jgi:hypothetical protein
MSQAEQSQPSELGLAEAASRISLLMDGSPQPEVEKQGAGSAEVEETEATAETANDAPEGVEQASSEDDSTDEGEVVEAEAEDDAQDEQDEDNSLYTVVIDGKEQKVTLQEALSGYQRQSDYTRKTQEVAERSKAIQAQEQQIAQMRSQYENSLNMLAQEMQRYLPQEPDWERLHQEDPINFPIIEKQWRDYKANAAAVQQEQARLRQEASQREMQQRQQLVEEGAKYIFEKMPEWKDQAKWNEARGKLREYGQKVGYSEEELNAALDPRAILVLEKARRWDSLQANRPQPQKAAAPKPMRAGTPASSPRKQTEVTKVQQRLKSSGRVEDAAALFMMLDSKR